MALFRKKQPAQAAVTYDPADYRPVLRCSICTGEQTAGFRDRRNGRFHEIMLIRNEQDLEEFKSRYHVETLEKEY